ncbi:MAG: polyprenyl synthetase family protein [candidate division WOR-3 bacterium]|nr:MAG: polyprenyl synthetase family protein [candidate division WOR-3 bacterium]
MKYAVLGRGKRIRSILALESYRACGGRSTRWIVPFCCGIEMIHAFSLVHDDLPCMDDDDFRRGKPSLHRRFGEATAILAADALFARAFELFTSGAAPADRRLAATAAIAKAIGPLGMAGGQLLDVQNAGQGGSRSGAAVQRLKTAEFLAASMESGAILAGVAKRLCGKLREGGVRLGLLFQTTDDLLDSGRPVGGRKTLPDSRRLEDVRRLAVAQAASAERALASLGARFLVLASFPHHVLTRKE